MTEKLVISRKSFCKKTGLSASSLCELLQGPLKEAGAPGGIDSLHPCIEAYFNDPKRQKDKRRAHVELSSLRDGDSSPPRSNERDVGDPGWPDLHKIANMTIKECAVHWRSIEQFKDYLQAFKLLQDALKQEIGNAKEKRKLVSRELTITVFSLVEEGNQRLLTDFPESITRKVYTMCKAGEPIEKARGAVRDAVADVLSNTVRRVKQGLAGLNDGELDSSALPEQEDMEGV